MRRGLILLVLAMLFGLLFAQAALANTVYITHETTGTVTINEGDSVIFQVYWYAGTPGLVQEAIRCSLLTVQITQNGTTEFFAGPPQTKAYWGPVQAAPPEVVSAFLRANNHGKTPISLAYWQIALPTEELDPGSYTFHWTWELTHRTVDLGDWDGNGHIDHYGLPDVLERDVTLVIQ